LGLDAAATEQGLGAHGVDILSSLSLTPINIVINLSAPEAGSGSAVEQLGHGGATEPVTGSTLSPIASQMNDARHTCCLKRIMFGPRISSMALPFTNRTNELKDLDAAAKAGVSRTI